jgi:hypothetical protein
MINGGIPKQIYLRLSNAGSLADVEVRLIYLRNEILPTTINAEAKEEFFLVPLHGVSSDN